MDNDDAPTNNEGDSNAGNTESWLAEQYKAV